MAALVTFAAAVVIFALGSVTPAAAADRATKIVALGDSLTAGYGLSANETFPAKLARALQATGAVVSIINAGVSGDTASAGLARLDWSVPADADAVILELGANDALRGVNPQVTRTALAAILQRLKARGIPVLLCGMRAPPNLGRDYVRAHEQIYPELAAAYDALFYPFFLDGIAAVPQFNQPDAMHPSAAGIDIIVTRILPKVEQLIARVKTARGP